jgi:hypothetical protein
MTQPATRSVISLLEPGRVQDSSPIVRDQCRQAYTYVLRE